MNRRRLEAPPPSLRAERLQRAIIGHLASRCFAAYAVFVMVAAALGRPLIDAIGGHSTSQVVFLVAGIFASYLVLGGVLCVSFVDQCRSWPPPAPRIRFHGRRFVLAWIVSAPRLLVDLSRAWQFGRARP